MEDRVVLEKMKELRNIEEADSELIFAAERCLEMVQAYCSISDIPDALLGVCTCIGLDLYDHAVDTSDITQIREGEVSISFGAHKSDGDLLSPYRRELLPYCKLNFN